MESWQESEPESLLCGCRMVNKDCIKQHVSFAQKGLETLTQVKSPAFPPAPLSSSTVLTSVSFQELWAGRGSFISEHCILERDGVKAIVTSFTELNFFFIFYVGQ